MKIILLLFCFTLVSQPSYSEPKTSIRFNSIEQFYEFSEQPIIGQQLFSFLGLQSGLEIRFAPSLAQQSYTLPNNLTEQELLRWLANNLSLVQGYNKNNILISLTLLPKGLLQSEQLIYANSPVNEGKAHQLGKTNQTAQQRFKLRVNELSHQQKLQLEQQIDRGLERKNMAEAREARRQATRKKELQSLVAQLSDLRNSDPELYRRMLSINKSYYPSLESKLNERQASE